MSEGLIQQSINGTDTSDANANSSQILSGASAYVKGNKINGSMPNRGAWGTSISPGSSVTIPNGYHSGSGVVSAGASTGHRVSQGTFSANNQTSVYISCEFQPSSVVVAMTSSYSLLISGVPICGASNNGSITYDGNAGRPGLRPHSYSGGVSINSSGFSFNSGSSTILHSATYSYIAID